MSSQVLRITATTHRGKSTRQALRFNAFLILIVWLAWVVFARQRAWHSVVQHWHIALTMVLGSLVGGGTSEGGAAIAFPVFTKILHIPPADARLFSFAIQTVGMGAASLSILYQRIPIEKRAIVWAGAGGVFGMVFSTYVLQPLVPSVLVRVFFTAMVTSLACVLLLPTRTATIRLSEMPIFGTPEKLILLSAGILGGVLSGLIGCGENIVVFMVMVVLFHVNEKVVTPTTVLLMWIVTAAAFLLHLFFLRDFPPRVIDYWLAAVPVVVVGAPLGALLCAQMQRETIVGVLVCLIALELVSTIILVPMSSGIALGGVVAFSLFGLSNWLMSRSRRYTISRRRVQI